ncbi:uncharacterized protein [Zea mays]|jgi:hypothetical protein|uniref:Uncharacterized protein n=1 Tax=Zea mays TaxID=4577 RepID=C0PJE4_MAIZE|nr:uncharacterized protein LOC118476275 [Zea mays]ACN35310.1 unknown [Zea mays]|eukprot:XP_020403678.1 uncharacterized protein LOC100383836 [Zea mays]
MAHVCTKSSTQSQSLQFTSSKYVLAVAQQRPLAQIRAQDTWTSRERLGGAAAGPRLGERRRQRQRLGERRRAGSGSAAGPGRATVGTGQAAAAGWASGGRWAGSGWASGCRLDE